MGKQIDINMLQETFLRHVFLFLRRRNVCIVHIVKKTIFWAIRWMKSVFLVLLWSLSIIWWFDDRLGEIYYYYTFFTCSAIFCVRVQGWNVAMTHDVTTSVLLIILIRSLKQLCRSRSRVCLLFNQIPPNIYLLLFWMFLPTHEIRNYSLKVF